MDFWDLCARLGCAALLGGAIGLERHWSDKAAGLRTHMLVSLGAALFMIVSAHGFDDVLSPSRVELDPSRVAAQVVSGIGFLGAGAILRRHEAVVGLTTAASIWAVAALGLAAGGGLYVAAAITTAIILAILTVMRWVESRVRVRPRSFVLAVSTRTRDAASQVVETILDSSSVNILDLRVRGGDRPTDRVVRAVLARPAQEALPPLVAQLQTIEEVFDIRYGLRNR